MSDQRIRNLFDQLDSVPSVEFEASLHDRLLERLATFDATSDGIPSTSTHENIVTITDRPEGLATSGPPWKRRITSLVAAAAVAAALVITGVLVSRDDNDPAAPVSPVAPSTTVVTSTSAATTTPPPTVPPTWAPVDVSVATPIPAPTTLTAGPTLQDPGIFQIKFDGFNLWALGAQGTPLKRIDTSTGQVAETLTLPSPARQDWMEANAGLLYVPVEDGIVIVNGETKEMTTARARSADGFVPSMAFTSDTAWLVRDTGDTNMLEQWDLQLTTLRSSTDIGKFPAGGMVGTGAGVYISTDGQGLLHFGLDGTQLAPIADVGFSFDIAFGAGSVWVPSYDSGEVFRVDTATNQIVARIRVAGGLAHSVAVTDTVVFATVYGASTVSAIDPATNTVTAQASTASSPMSMAIAGGLVWTASDGEVRGFQPS